MDYCMTINTESEFIEFFKRFKVLWNKTSVENPSDEDLDELELIARAISDYEKRLYAL